MNLYKKAGIAVVVAFLLVVGQTFLASGRFPAMLFNFTKAELQVGDLAPEVEVETDVGESINIRNHGGKWLIIYFYPKNNTAGCTAQAEGFRDLYPDFQAAGAEVLGVSTLDSERSHEKFQEEYDLPFPRAVEHQKKLAKAFGVTVFLGTCMRDTIVIDKDGRVVHVLQGVDPNANPKQVLKLIQNG